MPLPRELKLKLSVEDSKGTRVNCGLEPPRVQVTVVCVTFRLCSAAVSLLKRAKRLRVCPPMFVKFPPTKILPSACTAIEETVSSAFGTFGLNESAAPVVASSRAMWLRVWPPMLIAPRKSPPAKTLPLACSAIDTTVSFAFGLKVESSVPSEFRRAMRLRVTVPPRSAATVEKKPPAKTLPSGWTAMVRTSLSVFGLNESARPVVASSRAM